MINIDIVQNKEFSIGYPYHSPIDSYFKSLSPAYISNYNINDTTLEEINVHKRDIQKFDSKLFTLMNDVSIFVQDYKVIKDTIVAKYDAQVEQYNSFIISKKKLEDEREIIETEILFMGKNKAKLVVDLNQIEELLTHYDTELMTSTIVDPVSFVGDLNNDIILIDSTLVTVANSIDFYIQGIENDIVAHVTDIKLISMYSFEEVLLKKSFESWSLRNEKYYQCLVAFYRLAYESVWTHGNSIMYDKNLDYVSSSKHIMVDNSNKFASDLIKQYKFGIEKKLKLKSIELATANDTPSPSELQDIIINNHIALLNIDIEEVTTTLRYKQFAIDSIISPNDFRDYNTYKELIQLKRHYISSNIKIISENPDEPGIYQYDDRIASLKSIFTAVELKLGEKTYLKYYYDFERTNTVLEELKHTLDILNLTKTGVVMVDTDVDVIETKIETYTTLKNNLTSQIDSINNLNSLKLIEKTEISDHITLISSNLFGTKKTINTFVSSYEEEFKKRLPQFYEDASITQAEIIQFIISGNIDYAKSLGFEKIKEYTSELKWWNEKDKQTIFIMYDNIIEFIETTMETQWSIEFNHPIIGIIKSDFYKGYLALLISNLYARMVQYINYKEYNLDIEKELMVDINNITEVLNDYIPMAIMGDKDVEVQTLFYDTRKKVSFETSVLNAVYIIGAITSYLMNNYNYIVSINLSYQLKQVQTQEQLKIDLMWKNMEIKNG